MIQLSQDVINSLERMRCLNAIIKTDEMAEEEICEEYRKIQDEMVEEFMPLIQKLAKSGLLTASIEENEKDEKYLSDEYDLVAGDVDSVFKNGNIWIHANSVSTAGCKNGH